MARPRESVIVLFTGVRYERMPDPPASRENGDKGAPGDGGVGGGKRKRG